MQKQIYSILFLCGGAHTINTCTHTRTLECMHTHTVLYTLWVECKHTYCACMCTHNHTRNLGWWEVKNVFLFFLFSEAQFSAVGSVGSGSGSVSSASPSPSPSPSPWASDIHSCNKAQDIGITAHSFPLNSNRFCSGSIIILVHFSQRKNSCS